MSENRIVVPQEWIHYVVNPHTFNYFFKKFDFPRDVINDLVNEEIAKFEIPAELFSYGVPYHNLTDEKYRIYMVFK